MGIRYPGEGQRYPKNPVIQSVKKRLPMVEAQPTTINRPSRIVIAVAIQRIAKDGGAAPKGTSASGYMVSANKIDKGLTLTRIGTLSEFRMSMKDQHSIRCDPTPYPPSEVVRYQPYSGPTQIGMAKSPRRRCMRE